MVRFFLPWFMGTINCVHGRFPLPARATARFMQGKPVLPTCAQEEPVTPTGAALGAPLSTLSRACPERRAGGLRRADRSGQGLIGGRDASCAARGGLREEADAGVWLGSAGIGNFPDRGLIGLRSWRSADLQGWMDKKCDVARRCHACSVFVDGVDDRRGMLGIGPAGRAPGFGLG
ncbi:MAG: DUF111 family protein [Desulfovibrio sp.]|nr:DUF111 family protein [Desulfovibrio sp.]